MAASSKKLESIKSRKNEIIDVYRTRREVLLYMPTVALGFEAGVLGYLTFLTNAAGLSIIFLVDAVFSIASLYVAFSQYGKMRNRWQTRAMNRAMVMKAVNRSRAAQYATISETTHLKSENQVPESQYEHAFGRPGREVAKKKKIQGR